MVILGGVELNREIVWSDRFKTSTIISENKRFLAGNARILQASIAYGTLITLEALSDQGWLTKAKIDALVLLSNSLGSIYVLDYEGELYNVMFDHSEGSALEFEALVVRPIYDASDYFSGSIHLITV